MAKPSRLSEKQWNEIIERNLRGESIRFLAREFNIAESAIRKKITAQVTEIKSVVNQTLEAEKKFSLLPIGAQIIAHSLADDLRAISTHLASAAKYGSMTAHRLSGIAFNQLDKINEENLDESLETIQHIARLNAVANESAKTGLNLLSANKKAIENMNSLSSEDLNEWTDADERRLKELESL